MSDLQKVLQVVNMLARRGVLAVIAGGAARDSLLGLVPKDYDLIILSDEDESEVTLEALSDYGLDCTTYGIAGDEYTGQGAAESHLLWVIKTHLIGVDIDIIQQRHMPLTALAAVEGFDVSLNMAWFEQHDDKNGVWCNHPTDYPQPGEMVKILRTCDFPASRIPYLAAKHPGYQWPDVSALLLQQAPTPSPQGN